ncbi:MAG: hypothetical protein ACM3JC_12020 [Rudaea sp.]
MAKALVLIAPGLLAWPRHELARSRSLATLALLAAAPRSEPRGIAVAMLAALGARDGAPVAPLALLGAGADPGADYVLCADPVYLVADRDTVVLAQVVDDLGEDAAHALVDALNRHFADDDLRFESMRPDAWFARRHAAADLVTTPPDAARGRKLIASLPRGRDAAIFKRWQNEIEMLLHTHPVNAARDARGAPLVSAVWLWGGGRLDDQGAMPVAHVVAGEGRLGDVARGVAAHGDGIALPLRRESGLARIVAGLRDAEPPSAATHVLAVLPATMDALSLDRDWLAPALAELFARRVERVCVVADGHGAAVTWTLAPPRPWSRLMARAARRRFEVPAAPDA